MPKEAPECLGQVKLLYAASPIKERACSMDFCRNAVMLHVSEAKEGNL